MQLLLFDSSSNLDFSNFDCSVECLYNSPTHPLICFFTNYVNTSLNLLSDILLVMSLYCKQPRFRLTKQISVHNDKCDQHLHIDLQHKSLQSIGHHW